MPYTPQSRTGQHALDETQELAASKQYSWKVGAGVTLTSSTSSIETDIAKGTVVFDGEDVSISQTTRTHEPGDSQHPRWDALCVTDRTGTVEVIAGLPAEPITTPNGNVIRGESAYKPTPSDAITDEMVCLAIVWIPSGATTNDDLTDTSAGGVPEPIVDRRLYQEGQVTQTTNRKTITASGWYTIASSPPLGTGPSAEKRANGLFTVRDTQSGRHSSITFYASYMYGDQPTITLLNSSEFAPGGANPRAINGIRIVEDGTQDGAMVQINVQLGDRSQIDFAEYTLQNNYHYDGWYPEQWIDGNLPQGFEDTLLSFNDFDHVLATAANGSSGALFSVDRDGVVRSIRSEVNDSAARAWLSSNFQVDGSGQTIPYNQVTTDDWGAWNTATGEFTVPYDGWYTVHGHARIAGAAVGERLDLLVINNGASEAVSRLPIGAQTVATFGVQTVIDAAAGDTITIEERHSESDTNTVTGNFRETYATVVFEG